MLFYNFQMRAHAQTKTGIYWKGQKTRASPPPSKKVSTAPSVPYKNQNNERTNSEIFRPRFRDAFPHYPTFR